MISHHKEQLFFYDVTSRYLEGDYNALAAWGYNRDHQEGKKQVVAGLLSRPGFQQSLNPLFIVSNGGWFQRFSILLIPGVSWAEPFLPIGGDAMLDEDFVLRFDEADFCVLALSSTSRSLSLAIEILSVLSERRIRAPDQLAFYAQPSIVNP